MAHTTILYSLARPQPPPPMTRKSGHVQCALSQHTNYFTTHACSVTTLAISMPKNVAIFVNSHKQWKRFRHTTCSRTQ